MNVIVSNINRNVFANLDVDVIKSINGEFTADEIVQSFSNFFFNRMFLDITSIENYNNINNLKKISIGLDVSKIILYLSNDAVVNSDNYISTLISMGFYNFARNQSELKYLYDNPNSYKDVAHLQKINPQQEIIQQSQRNSIISPIENSIEKIRIIGFKNFTNHAGATSLIYMLKKQLSKNYNIIAIEVNKRDFMFFNDKDMISCRDVELKNTCMKYTNCNIILIDLNNLDLATAHSVCDDVIYLMESSTLMINKLVMLDNQSFSKISGNKVILNKSLLNQKDIKQLQFESGIEFFAILPPLNDREDNSNELFPMLEKLGLYIKN